MQVPFARDSYLSEIPINWYPATDTDKGVIMYGAPGLKELIRLKGEVRGLKAVGTNIYAVSNDTAYKIDQHFNATALGTLNTNTGKVWIEENGVQVAFMDGDLWVYTIATATFAQVTDADFPGGASLTYQDGYGIFIVPGTGQFYLTGLYDFTSIAPLDYASAEGWPDDLVAVLMNYREIWLFGEETTEIWYNAGTSPFPFARVQGGFIEQGCAAPASVAKGDNVSYWLASTRQVMMAEGYQPRIISTRKMEREIEKFSRIDDAIAWFQVFEGHSFYWLTFPTADVTYVYDAATQVWHKRASFPDQGRHRANCYAYFNKQHIAGDYNNGKLYRMSRDYYDDDGEELIAAIESPEVRGEGKRQFFSGLEVQFERGHDYLDGRDPYAMLCWSDDNGNNWSNEVWSSLGNIGEYRTRTIWRRMGSSYNRIFKLKVSDPVNRDILSVNWL